MDTTVDIGRRLVQMFWDREPTNDIVRDQPVWCLGSSYRLNSSPSPKKELSPAPESSTPRSPRQPPAQSSPPATSSATATNTAGQLPETPPESGDSSLDSSLAYDEAPLDSGWPPAFLDDFESRIWMTYRSEFDPIAKSQDPKSLSALSFSMRLKTQLSDQSGFASDSGWGCMIRSGQSLLANAMAVHRLGRGTYAFFCTAVPSLGLLTTISRYRVAERHPGAARTGDTIPFCGRPESALFNTQLRAPWCHCLWQIPRRVVRPFSNGKMYPVRAMLVHIVYPLPT
jgi:hypothetical protein